MRTYWLTDRSNGDVALVDGATVERVLGVEVENVDQCIRNDGRFENVNWVVRVSGVVVEELSRGLQQAKYGVQVILTGLWRR